MTIDALRRAMRDEENDARLLDELGEKNLLELQLDGLHKRNTARRKLMGLPARENPLQEGK